MFLCNHWLAGYQLYAHLTPDSKAGWCRRQVVQQYCEMSTIMKCIICYSRLDFTAHYLCRFSYTEFPWASQVLCWCKCEQSQSSDLYILSIHLHVFNHPVCVFFWAALPCHPLGWGCLFQWKLNVKNRIQMWHFSSTAAPLRVCSAPEHEWLGQQGQALCSHRHECEESPPCAAGSCRACFACRFNQEHGTCACALAGTLWLGSNQQFVLTIHHRF